MIDKELIETYFLLTGRPIATMTVDEYLAFASAGIAGGGRTSSSVLRGMPQIVQTPEVTPEDVEDTAPLQSVTSSSQKSAFTAQPEKKQPEPKEPSKPEIDALQMLKSIAG